MVGVALSWQEVLDGLEGYLDRCEAASLGQGDWPQPYVSAPGEGEMTAAQRARAQDILERIRSMEDRVVGLRDGMAASLAAIGQINLSITPAPVYLDQRA
jgi:cell division septum initiation protein DivIVA